MVLVEVLFMSWKKHAAEFKKFFKEIALEKSLIEASNLQEEWHDTKDAENKKKIDESFKKLEKIIETILHESHHENLNENNFMYRAIIYHELHEKHIDELNEALEQEELLGKRIELSKNILELVEKFIKKEKKYPVFLQIIKQVEEDQVLLYCKQLIEDEQASFREFKTYFLGKYVKKFYKRQFTVEKELYRDDEKGIIITRQSTPIGKNKEYRYTYTKNGEERAYIFGYPSDKTSFYLQYLWNPENPKPPRVEQKRYDANEAWKDIKNKYFDAEGNILPEFKKEERKRRKELEKANNKRKKYVQKTREKRSKQFAKIKKEFSKTHPNHTEEELKAHIKDKNRSEEIVTLVKYAVADIKEGLGLVHLTAIIEPSFAELANKIGMKRTGFRNKAGPERFVYYVKRL